jgi:hypothetical protein
MKKAEKVAPVAPVPKVPAVGGYTAADVQKHIDAYQAASEGKKLAKKPARKEK